MVKMIRKEDIQFNPKLKLDELITVTEFSRVHSGVLGGMKVVVKLPNYTFYPDIIDFTFHKENETASLVSNHTNIFEYLGAYTNGDFPYALVSKHIEGKSLLNAVFDNELDWKQIPMNSIFSYIRDIADALEHIASRGVVYRDLHMNNVMIDSRGDNARLIDFGLARKLDETGTYLENDRIEGSFDYLAPEVFDTGRCSETTDAHSLLVVFYEALFGKRPFEINTKIWGVENYSEIKEIALDSLSRVPIIYRRDDFGSSEFYNKCSDFFESGFFEGFENLQDFIGKFDVLERCYYDNLPATMPASLEKIA